MWRRVEKNDGLWRIVSFLPVAVPVMLAVFSSVSIIWLIINQFNGWFVWPTASVAAAGAGWLLYKKYPHDKKPSREDKVCSALVVLGVFLWIGFNTLYTSQHIHTNRDPATYAVSGVWLANHDNLQIPFEFPFGADSEEIKQSSAGFDSSETFMFAQGAHLLPALLGLVGKITSPSVLLHASPLFGGTALLALYAFARLLMRQRWAVVAVAVMAVSLPLIYFSRDTYTEPLALTFAFGAMALVTVAYRTRERALWVLAGAAAGAGQLARIDGILFIIGLVFAVLAMLVIAKKKDRTRLAVDALAFFLALSAVVALGFLDVMLLSSGYFLSQLDNIALQLIVLAVVLVAGIITITAAWTTRVTSFLDQATKRWRSVALAGGIGFLCLVLASRPLWMIGHRESSIRLTEGLEVLEGLPVDGFRDFSEMTINWMVWYMGLPVVVLALAGLMIAAYRAMKSRDIVWIMLLAVVFGAALAYFVKPSITPDQIWASRRFLPIVMPGIAVLGAFAIYWLDERKQLPWKLDKKVITASLGTLVIAAAYMTTSPFVQTKTYAGMLDQTEDVCRSVPSNAAILWVGEARLNQVQPTRSVCSIKSAGYLGSKLKPDILAKASQNARANGLVPYLGVYGSEFGFVSEEDVPKFTGVSAITYEDLTRHLTHQPRTTTKDTRVILLAEINPDGSFKKMREATQ